MNLRGVSPSLSNSARFPLQVQLRHKHAHRSFQALLDTSAAENLISNQLISEIQVPLEVLDCPITVMSVDGCPLQPFPIRHRTVNIRMQIGQHMELVSVLVISSSVTPLILGYPWLQTHDLHIFRSTKRILQWGPDCQTRCQHPIPFSPFEVTVIPTIAIGLYLPPTRI